jgi:predicted dehydrogenase
MAMELESGVVGTWAMSHATSRSDALFQVVGTEGMLVLDNLTRLRHHKANGTPGLMLLHFIHFFNNPFPHCPGEVEEVVFEPVQGAAKQDLVDEFEDFHRAIMRTVTSDDEPAEAGQEGFLLLPHAPLVHVEDSYHHLAVIAAAIASTITHQREHIKTWQAPPSTPP